MDSDDEELNEEEFMSNEEIQECIQETEAEKERLHGKSGTHWPPLAFEEILEPTESTHFQPGFHPQTRTIQQDKFASPLAVFVFVYPTFFTMITFATNLVVKRKNEKRAEVQEVEIQKFFGMKLIEKRWRGGDTCEEFWSRVFHHPEAWGLSDLDFLSYNRYKEISSCLDIGEDSYRTVNETDEHRKFDILKKLSPLIDLFNLRSPLFKKIYDGETFCIDESLRKSFSRFNPIKNYMPMKPAKYGIKSQLLCTSRQYILSKIPCLPGSFKLYSSIGELVLKLIPSRYLGKGICLTVDNYYSNRSVLEVCNTKRINLLATLKTTYLGPYLGKVSETFTSPSESLSKGFKRSFRVFRCTNEKGTCEIGVFRDKPQKKPVLTLNNCPSLFAGQGLPNASNLNIGGTPGHQNIPKPGVILRYNKSMAPVDTVDQILSRQSIRSTVRNKERSWTVFARLVIFHYFDEMVHNCFVLTTDNMENVLKTSIPKNFRKDWYLLLARELIGKKAAHPVRLPEFGPEKRPRANNDCNEEILISPAPKKNRNFRRQCKFCPEDSPRISVFCSHCNAACCKNHRHFVCDTCRE